MSDPAFLFAKFFHLCRATTYDGEIKVYIFSSPAFSALPFPGLRGGELRHSLWWRRCVVAGETATTTGSVIPAQRNRATTKMNKMRSSRERDPGSRDGHVMRRLRAARPPARPLATRSPGIIVRRTAAKFDSQRPAKFCRLFSRSPCNNNCESLY